MSQFKTQTRNSERLFFVDVIRLLSMVAIAHFHLHEATFFSNTHNHIQHGLLELPLVTYSRFMAFSGFSIVFISYFMIGLIGLSKAKLKQLLVVAGLGALVVILIFFEDASSLGEWDIYHYVAIASLFIMLISRWTALLVVISALGLVALSLPPDTWFFNSLREHTWYNPLFGDYKTQGLGSWPLVPWLGLSVIAFTLGRGIKENPLLRLRLKTFSKKEGLVWALVATLCAPAWGAFLPVPIGPDFYKFVHLMPRYPLIAHLFFTFLFLRLGFVTAINEWAQRKPYLRWISNIYLNKKFFLFYIVNWIVIGVVSNFASFYNSHWPVFDLVVLGLFPTSEFICRSLIKSSKEIRGYLGRN